MPGRRRSSSAVEPIVVLDKLEVTRVFVKSATGKTSNSSTRSRSSVSSSESSNTPRRRSCRLSGVKAEDAVRDESPSNTPRKRPVVKKTIDDITEEEAEEEVHPSPKKSKSNVKVIKLVKKDEGNVEKIVEQITPTDVVTVPEKIDEVEPKEETKNQPENKENALPTSEPIAKTSGATEKHKNVETSVEAMKRRCKSGRFWKSDRDRFRSVVKSKGRKLNFQNSLRLKEEMKRVKEYEKALKDEVKQQKEDLRARQEENKKRRDENQRKNEVVQQIKNPAKLKRMKKKQLRQLAKRDTTVVAK